MAGNFTCLTATSATQPSQLTHPIPSPDRLAAVAVHHAKSSPAAASARPVLPRTSESAAPAQTAAKATPAEPGQATDAAHRCRPQQPVMLRPRACWSRLSRSCRARGAVSDRGRNCCRANHLAHAEA